MENRAVFSIPSMFPNRLFGNGNIVNPFIFNPRSLFGKSSSSSVFPYDSCSSPNGVMGICATSGTCNQISGTASGSCAFGTVCCISKFELGLIFVTLNELTELIQRYRYQLRWDCQPQQYLLAITDNGHQQFDNQLRFNN